REMGILTVAVVTRPFSFEGKKRLKIADSGLAELAEHCDSLITIPNEKLLEVLGKNTSLLHAFKEANDVLLGAVQGIADLIIRPGMINVDFADVRTVMSEMGMSMMGTGSARGENRAVEAAEAAVRSPLLEDVDLQGARGILVNITAGLDLGLGEFSEVGQVVEEFASENATVVVGTVIDPEMVDDIKVTVVATGLQKPEPASETVKVVSNSNSRKPSGELDLQQLELPAVLRRKADHISAEKNNPAEQELSSFEESKSRMDDETESYLDIPTFLRRQAD
ncbi:MAG: cell division protein FtsZ, partial [Amphritea sp.]|nr:cell division protein FtsZ [Amphritea sp.]